MYAILKIQLNISFVMFVLNQHASNPDSFHWQAVKHIFCHLKGSIQLQLNFRGPLQALLGYSNIDGAGDYDI